MPYRPTAEPFTWQSSTPHSSWTATTYVVCALVAAGGYFFGRTVAARDTKVLDQTMIEEAGHMPVAARENVTATVRTGQNTSAEAPSRPIATSARLDLPSVALLSPDIVQRPKAVSLASTYLVAGREEAKAQGGGPPLKRGKKGSVITVRSKLNQNTRSGRSFADRTRVVVSRPLRAKQYQPRQYRDSRLKGLTLREVAMKLHSSAP
jgi:hypothetical protein